MDNGQLTTYLETAAQFIASAKTVADRLRRERAVAKVISGKISKDETAVLKTIKRLERQKTVEYRVTPKVKGEVSAKDATIKSDQNVSAGAKLIVGDTMYDRTAESIINSIETQLSQ